MNSTPHSPGQPPADGDIASAVDRITGSVEFRGANRQQAFLRFVVGESLAGRGSEIKETLIATSVYEKRPDYDPHVDSTVRVEASKLRQRLQRYYDGSGADDPVRISIPKGAYAPVFQLPAGEVSAPAARIPAKYLWACGGALTVAAVAFALRPSVPEAKDFRLSRVTEAGSYSTGASGGPHLDAVVYSADRDGGALNLWLQNGQDGPPVRLTRSSFHHETPTLSADAKYVVFRTDEAEGNLAVVPAAGGEIRRIKDTAGALHPRLSPSGATIAYWIPRDHETRGYGRVLLTSLDSTGGFGPVRLFGDFAHAATPIWSQSGKRIAVLGTWQSEVPEKEFDAWVVSLDGMHPAGTPVKTGLFPLLKERGIYQRLTERAAIEIGDWRDDWLYFTAPAGEVMDLYRVRLPESGGTVQGQPERLTFGAGDVRSPRLTSRNGIVFDRSSVSYDLYSLRLPKPGEPAADLKRHTSETGLRLRPGMDRDGTCGVWETRTPSSDGQLLFFDLHSGVRRPLTKDDGRVYSHAILSPDGALAAFRILEPGVQPIYLQSTAGGEPRKICPNCGTPADWTADGKHLLYVTGGQPAIIGLLEVETGKYRDMIHHPNYSLYGPRARLDSRGDGWVALYAGNSARSRQIFLVPVKGFQPGPQRDWVPLTDGTGWDQSPAWSEDGKTIYYVVRHGGYSCIMAKQIGGPSWEVRHFHSPRQTLMRSVSNRGADSLWVAGGRLYFTLDDRTSDIWRLSR